MQNEKVVPFRNQDGISHSLIQRLLAKVDDYGLTAIFPFSIDKIEVAEWVRLKCHYGCSRFGSNWTCPPATPGTDKVREIIAEYDTALLLVGTKSCSDFYLDNGRKRISQVRCWKGTVSMERLLFLKGYYKAFSLVGECCALCKECAYPESCRFPQEKRPSVESFSIDMFGTLENLGKTSTIATQTCDTYNYYGIILLE